MTVLMQLTVPATGARASGCAAGRNNAAAAQWAVWAPAAQQGPTVMLPTPAAAASCTAAVAHAGTDATLVPATGARAPGCAAGRNNAAAAQWAVWAPAAQQGPTVMLPTPAAAASCTAAVAHAGTDATLRASNRRKSTRLRSRSQQRSCSSVGSVGAGGPAGTDRDAADACRSGIMHRGSRTCRYRCNSPWQQPAQEHPAAQPAQQRSCSSVGSVGAWRPSRTDRDAADACRSGIMHRGSRTCRYRCNSPCQQPAQEHPAAQPVATTQLQLSGQCGRRRPSRDRP